MPEILFSRGFLWEWRFASQEMAESGSESPCSREIGHGKNEEDRLSRGEAVEEKKGEHKARHPEENTLL